MTSLTTALPLTNGIANQICFSMIDYLTNINVWTKQVFSSAQYAYIKKDLSSTQRPSVFCYPTPGLQEGKNSFSYSYRGSVTLEVHFSLQEQRLDLAQNIIQIISLLELINLNADFTRHAQTTMSGLYWIGKSCRPDYSKAYAKEAVAKLLLDFNVDLQAYQNGLRAQGFEITSPDEQIYVIVNALQINNELIP